MVVAAMLAGGYVLIEVVSDDVKELAPYIFSHRIMLSPKGKSVVKSNEEAIEKIVMSVEVPVA